MVARAEQQTCALSGSGSDRGLPDIEGLAAQNPMGVGGDQMTADVECVVTG